MPTLFQLPVSAEPSLSEILPEAALRLSGLVEGVSSKKVSDLLKGITNKQLTAEVNRLGANKALIQSLDEIHLAISKSKSIPAKSIEDSARFKNMAQQSGEDARFYRIAGDALAAAALSQPAVGPKLVERTAQLIQSELNRWEKTNVRNNEQSSDLRAALQARMQTLADATGNTLRISRSNPGNEKIRALVQYRLNKVLGEMQKPPQKIRSSSIRAKPTPRMRKARIRRPMSAPARKAARKKVR